MYYVFAAGYKSLLFALYIKNVSCKEIVIITYSTNIVKYCEAENIKYILIDQFPPRISSIFKLFAFKRKLDEIIKKIDLGKEDAYIILGMATGYGRFYLAKELSKKGNVYHRRIVRELKKFKPSWSKPIFIKGILYKIIMKLIFDLNIMYYETNKDPRMGVDNDFLKKYNIRDYAPDLHTEEIILEAVKKSKINYRDYDNLIVDDGLSSNILKTDSLQKLYKNLFEMPIEFAFKKHPKPLEQMEQVELSFYEPFKHCDELPMYIPVELFFNNIKKNVLSVFSASLIIASKLEHIKTISLLELVDWHHETYKKEWRSHLIEKSNNKILFPKSFEELEEILLSS